MRKCRRRTDTIRTKELNIFEESRNKMMKNIETTEVRIYKRMYKKTEEKDNIRRKQRTKESKVKKIKDRKNARKNLKMKKGLYLGIVRNKENRTKKECTAKKSL